MILFHWQSSDDPFCNRQSRLCKKYVATFLAKLDGWMGANDVLGPDGDYCVREGSG